MGYLRVEGSWGLGQERWTGFISGLGLNPLELFICGLSAQQLRKGVWFLPPPPPTKILQARDEAHKPLCDLPRTLSYQPTKLLVSEAMLLCSYSACRVVQG